MRSARPATITCGLALWAMLALAPVVSACLDGSCALDEGMRSAHCGMPATVMLCCEEAPEQPAAASVAPGSRVLVATAARAPDTTPRERAEGPAPRVARAAHGPPLYRLFDALLI